jgi:hypothetical protein
VWLNGHEWAKRQAATTGLVVTELANGFAACDQPEQLQAICDRLGPAQIQGFFDRWMAQIPTPLTDTDRAAGYWWELSMRQVEVSRTIVFDDPRRARGFFEALVADNVGVGRPEQVAVLFARQVRTTTKEPFRTRVFGPGTEVKMDFAYKHSRVKQYLKQGRALRIETVINKPYDIGVLARLEHLPELTVKARAVNHRLLMLQRAGQGCAIETALFERVSQPYVREGQRTGAMRFGDPRAMALAGALCAMVHAVSGFTNKSLRSLVAGLLGADYTSAQMTYDLRRLRLHHHTPGPACRRLLYQARRPRTGAAAGRRPPASTHRGPPRLGHSRSRRRRLRHQRPPWHRSMKLVTTSRPPAPKND